ncbi:MAG: hypothetical protein K9K86_11380 [Pseudomonadales bacterium]|nr:hypothetical protein [Pseudomonadales bacterium]
MKKLTAILIALGASAGLAFGKIVYNDTLVSSTTKPAQAITQIKALNETQNSTVADHMQINQPNNRVAYQLGEIARELDHKIDQQMKSYDL